MAVRTPADYYAQLRAMLPPGPAWDAALHPELDEVLQGLAPAMATADQRSGDLLSEGAPLGEHELLPDWERVTGLPDACISAEPTAEERKKAVHQRRTGLGGQTPAYYLQLAASQGFPNAKIVEHKAPRFGRARFGRDHFGTWASQFMWTLYTGQRLTQGRRFGAAYFGERFGRNPAESLECLVRRAAPAHTVEHIVYEEAP
ncbi:YmfQ family protein [Pseudomonas sp. zfem005]|uniref:YmfQ family protein n=1 Tax=Pseudomonas sp. zfem005 TaxID=3078200 RepID=UPI00292A324F|nr:putative phage tail protein [Pseudomonas sp. zfem005]MDU9415228.1 putative phage tail protein [Pseudomonas sp. zfem005]